MAFFFSLTSNKTLTHCVQHASRAGEMGAGMSVLENKQEKQVKIHRQNLYHKWTSPISPNEILIHKRKSLVLLD